MNLIRQLFGKEEQGIVYEDIERLVSEKREENRILEYKSPSILNSPEQLSRYVSAFLNSDGGVIIIGVCEDDVNKKEKVSAKIYPDKIEPVPPSYSKERVDQLIHSNIRGANLPDIKIHPIRHPKAGAIYVIEVYPGQNPPYQAADDKYYRRLNSTIYPMIHSEIADFFGKRRKPLMGVRIEVLNIGIEDSSFVVSFQLGLANAGKAIAKYTFLSMTFDNVQLIGSLPREFIRIDNLRDGKPSFQYSNDEGVFHPSMAIVLGEIKLKTISTHKPIRITYSIVAEDMDNFKDEFQIPIDFLTQNITKKSEILTLLTPHLVMAQLGSI